ncbi:LysR family transcriptional regulator [Mesorhizobium sp. VK22B]|uniref:LysR family transcriptional regulator n=1 Tax=Mesorhizobium captivum TaxID=3072319 RepID=A0ABU4ZCB0_9HYPH|nr:LysR family transcriptional regulator [Mesorhizobium sp. VK22B]MDX8496593.1 LysR family transcriptional regulator [Mesorhizobium sp. VK22B]
MSQPSASRLIAALEEEVGATLFSRITRAVTLTEACDVPDCVDAILTALGDADHEARGAGELRGSLRIGTPISLALREIIPRPPAFVEQHPALKIELRLTDRYPDLVTEGIDVSLQFGALPDSSATARELHQPRILTTSPDYLRERGTPTMPSDLAHHSVNRQSSASLADIFLRQGGCITSVRVDRQLSITSTKASPQARSPGWG